MLDDGVDVSGLAAYNMVGRTIKDKWEVKELLTKRPEDTGSYFSVPYIVEKDGVKYFMKAFDFGRFLSMAPPKHDGSQQETSEIFAKMINAYRYERDLSLHCQSNYVTKVAFVVDFSEEFIEGYTAGFVPCLIFEAADGDVRKALLASARLDDAWKFKSLHDIAVGLKQLHAIDVSHQDLKPSNILIYNKEQESKLCDLGRSVCHSISGPYSKLDFTGDRNYAPPEIWYYFSDQDWHKRSFAIDCYMLGSLIVFYFTKISMSALLINHIPQSFHFAVWKGDFKEILPYLEKAFAESLDVFEKSINDSYFKKNLRILVEQLCEPMPDKRGHPANIKKGRNPYSMERFISTLDLLRHKAEIRVKKEL
ncbi:protein kinase domain-containing protein [Sulfurospirillum oryzae]|uniref:protein kinase domain-containing protein n=1 Tax=Sulfurospirillum oryzae TaxID=2976535 RepID=UPI0021E835FE|nr:protein kinase [Sulfurospirillum oryzae]